MNSVWLILMVLAAPLLLLAAVPLVVASDKHRIRRHLESKGMRLLLIRWRPFKRADMGEKMLREYDVVCQDESGATRRSLVKTAWLVAPEIRMEEVSG
jgi:hypothetical protein